MTRNNKSKRNFSPNSDEDNFINLPDLSCLKDDEKQHILSVLLRDENLRNKHLSRFAQLRKEVADLEKQSQKASKSVCARCQTPFGYIFNTGDTCPKCSAKVCKQCRLMYNVNDNGWLCQLCCKQMQLMSYSGEWVYSLQNNPRKNSVTTSEMVRKSLSPSVSIRNPNSTSSSDTEIEENSSSLNEQRFSSRNATFAQEYANNNNKNKMIVQTPIDEQKFNLIKQTIDKRPLTLSSISSKQLSRKSRELATSLNILTGGSSDDVDSLYDQPTNSTDRTSSSSIKMKTNNQLLRSSSIPESSDSFSTKRISSNQMTYINNNNNDKNRHSVDCASVTSSEWGAESEKNEPIIQKNNNFTKKDTKRNLLLRSNHEGSIQSLHDTEYRIIKPQLSTSQTSIASGQTSKSELSDTRKPLNINEKPNKSNSHSKLSTTDNSHLNSNKNLRDSSNTLASNDSNQRKISTTENHFPDKINNKQTKTETFGSAGNLEVVDSDDNDEDDIDKTFEKAKMGLANRTHSCMDMRGSQLSINSVLSEAKARYGLEISGKIELKLNYAITTGALNILINKCTNLARAKRNQTSDPYVKIYLLPDRSKNSKRKTTVKKNTIDPVFEEKFRYHITQQEFETRVLWISVWSRTSLGHNDFLGEIYIPLTNCTLDKTEEYQLVAQTNKHDLIPNIEPTMNPGEIQFQLTYIENPKNKDLGTLQVHYIEGKHIYYGKHIVDGVCKGLLMPDKIKRKLPTVRKGPSPRWEIPLRWDSIRRDNLKNTSIEISIWHQEHFRKTMLGFVRLNLAQGHFDNKPVKWLDSTKAEKSAWETFLRKPTEVHYFRLPLRPPIIDNK